MADCAITYCDEPATKAVQNGGVRLHVCPDHGDVYNAIPAATPRCSADGSTETGDNYRGGSA